MKRVGAASDFSMSELGDFRPSSVVFAMPLRPKSRHSASARDGLRLVDLDRVRRAPAHDGNGQRNVAKVLGTNQSSA